MFCLHVNEGNEPYHVMKVGVLFTCTGGGIAFGHFTMPRGPNIARVFCLHVLEGGVE